MGRWIQIICVGGLLIWTMVWAQSTDTAKVADTTQRIDVEELRRSLTNKIKGEILTVFDKDGKPVNRGDQGKGWHRVVGQATLQNGVDTIKLTPDLAKGLNDIRFADSASYFGRAVPMSARLHGGKSYFIYPLDGSSFVVMSSDSTDTATVRWFTEGE